LAYRSAGGRVAQYGTVLSSQRQSRGGRRPGMAASAEHPQHEKPSGGTMSGESLLVILLVGLIAGWLAGQIVQGTGFGLVADLCIGIIGDWLLPRLGIHLGTGMLAAIIAATIGAVVLLVILGLVASRGRWRVFMPILRLL